jgi:hypothetical protein
MTQLAFHESWVVEDFHPTSNPMPTLLFQQPSYTHSTFWLKSLAKFV